MRIVFIVIISSLFIACSGSSKNLKEHEKILSKFSRAEILFSIKSKECCFEKKLRIQFNGDSSLLPNIEELNSFAVRDLKAAFKTGLMGNNGASALTIHTDDRIDYYEIKDPKVKLNAPFIAAFIQKTKVNEDSQGNYVINGIKWLRTNSRFGRGAALCDCEKFKGQTAAVHFSGVAVGTDSLLTTAHGFSDLDDLEDYYVIFGFWNNSKNQLVHKIPKNWLYTTKDIISLDRVNDYAFLQLDRPVNHVGHQPPKFSDPIKDNKVYMMGYPGSDDYDFGLPLKATGNARVEKINSAKSYFESSLDAFEHNSGSPVFDSLTHNVIGIHKRSNFFQFGYCQPRSCVYSSIIYSPGKPWVQIVNY